MSEGECPLEEWVGLDTFRFCGAADRSAEPGASGAEMKRLVSFKLHHLLYKSRQVRPKIN